MENEDFFKGDGKYSMKDILIAIAYTLGVFVFSMSIVVLVVLAVGR